MPAPLVPLVAAGAKALGVTAFSLLLNECSGKAFEKTQVKFHRSAKLSEREKENFTKRLQDFERLTRSYNPGMFKMFNGWKIASPEGVRKLHPGFEIIFRTMAYYNFFTKTVVLPTDANNNTITHEACHYFDDAIRRSSGRLASRKQSFRDVSCLKHPEWPLENCVDDLHNIKRGLLIEEWAGVCSKVANNPQASLMIYSDNEMTLRQTLNVLDNLSYPEEIIDEYLDERILPEEPIYFERAENDAIYELIESTPLSTNYVGPLFNPRIRKLGHQAFASITRHSTLRLNFLNTDLSGELTIDKVEADFPEDFVVRDDFQIEMANRIITNSISQLYLYQNATLYTLASPSNRSFISEPPREIPLSGDLKPQMGIVENQLYFFTSEGLLPMDEDYQDRELENYPDIIQGEINLARSFHVLKEGDKRYLWIHHIYEAGQGYISRLYEINAIPKPITPEEIKEISYEWMSEEGSVYFKPILEIPLPYFTEDWASYPFLFEKRWHIFVTKSNHPLSEAMNEVEPSDHGLESINHRTLIEIGEDGYTYRLRPLTFDNEDPEEAIEQYVNFLRMSQRSIIGVGNQLFIQGFGEEAEDVNYAFMKKVE